ncbi:MAG: response regulator transcription factor [Candidatus Oceanisphaera merdipullorum]|nr:response regulator transcription factor [Candidatus Oceanisphaera merdipullorum]
MSHVANKKLLIVDNEPFITEELAEFFTDYGFICYCCASAIEAIETFKREPNIQIVISDMHMPGQNGLQLLQQLMLMAKQEQRLIEVILFTGEAEKDHIIMALKAGVADYYQKPLDMDALLAGVLRLAHRLDKDLHIQAMSGINERLHQLTESLQEIYQDVQHLNQKPSAPHKEQLVTEPPAQYEAKSSMGTALAKLSPRQQEVALLIGKGMTNYQISDQLGITENTVKLYASQILRLTNVSNRTQLALILAES